MTTHAPSHRFPWSALAIALCLIAFLVFPTSAASLPEHKYPRTAAFFLKTSSFTDEEIRRLALYEVVILDIQTQITNTLVHARLRAMNPEIVILGYTSGVEYPLHRLEEIEHPGGMWHQIGAGIDDAWYLRTVQGTHMSAWPGNVLMNPGAKNREGRSYADYLAAFLATNVVTGDRWDGLFFDTVWDGITWLDANADVDRDGQLDSKEKIDRAWRDGQNAFFAALRNRIGDEKLLVGNGVLEPFSRNLNGRMFESFPDGSEGGWPGSVSRYEDVSRIGSTPRIAIINRDTENTGDSRDWKRMRYGLATTLLFDGYYNFDWGSRNRDMLWRYDEYDVSLGEPSSLRPVNLLTGRANDFVSGLWMRNFENGVSLVNSTTEEKTWRFEEEFERIRGTQDPSTNDGRITRSVTLQGESGLVLLRPLDQLLDVPYVNGSFVRIFNKYGESSRNGFFSYERGQRGSLVVARRDLDNNGTRELLVADGNRMDIYTESGVLLRRWYPYTANYRGSFRFAVGDVDNNGRDDIVTIPRDNAPAHVRIFHSNGRPLTGGWFASPQSFRGGGSIALGDLDGDGVLEILVGAGHGASPRIRAYRSNGSSYGAKNGWLVYAPFVRIGVNVASGDLDGDGVDEIVVGAGRGGGPHIRILSGGGKLIHPGYFAFQAGRRDGVEVVVHDVDGDGRDEIIAMTTNVFTTAQVSRP